MRISLRDHPELLISTDYAKELVANHGEDVCCALYQELGREFKSKTFFPDNGECKHRVKILHGQLKTVLKEAKSRHYSA